MDTPRIPPRPESEWDDETRQILQGTLLDPAGKPINIFCTLAHHPRLMKRWLPFGTALLYQGELNPRDREIAILRTGWLCRSEYEFGQHVVIGRSAGLNDDEIRAITEGPDAGDFSDVERLILRAVDELHTDWRIGDATFEALGKHFGHAALIELVMLIGQYHLVAMTLNTAGVELDPGVPGFADLGVTP